MENKEEKYSNLIKQICTLVNRNKYLGVTFQKLEFYGVHKYSDEKIYKIYLDYNNEEIILYFEEPAFEDWQQVPWGGQTVFRPEDWNEWDSQKKLILTLCWCIYKQCIHWGNYKNRNDWAPPILE